MIISLISRMKTYLLACDTFMQFCTCNFSKINYYQQNFVILKSDKLFTCMQDFDAILILNFLLIDFGITIFCEFSRNLILIACKTLMQFFFVITLKSFIFTTSMIYEWDLIYLKRVKFYLLERKTFMQFSSAIDHKFVILSILFACTQDFCAIFFLNFTSINYVEYNF